LNVLCVPLVSRCGFGESEEGIKVRPWGGVGASGLSWGRFLPWDEGDTRSGGVIRLGAGCGSFLGLMQGLSV